MEADRTYLGGFCADNDMAAVTAFPDSNAALSEHFHSLHVLQQGTVALLVVLLDSAHSTELCGKFGESFLLGFLCHALIHIGPLMILALGGMEKILLGRADTAQRLEPEFSVFLFVFGCFQEYLGDLLIAVLFGYRCEICVFIACLRFACKGFKQVLFGLGACVFVCSRCSFGSGTYLLKLGGRNAAKRTFKVLGEFVANVLIAADCTSPDGLTALGLSHSSHVVLFFAACDLLEV